MEKINNDNKENIKSIISKLIQIEKEREKRILSLKSDKDLSSISLENMHKLENIMKNKNIDIDDELQTLIKELYIQTKNNSDIISLLSSVSKITLQEIAQKQNSKSIRIDIKF